MKGDSVMRNRRRKRKMHNRFWLILFAFSVLSMPKFAEASTKVEKGGYWLNKDTFITEYSIPAVYIGEGKFVDIDGNVRETSGENFKEEKTYLLYMSDNGTKETEDDVVLGVR